MRSIHSHMATVLAANPDLLVAHRREFERDGLTQLASWGAPGMSYLWLVQPYASDLVPVGIHTDVSAVGLSLLDNASAKASLKAFLCTELGTSQITLDEASSLLRAPGVLSLDGSRVLVGRQELARHRVVKTLGYARQPSATVYFVNKAGRPLSTFEICALRYLAKALVTAEISARTEIDAIKIDGIDITMERCNALRREGLIRPFAL